MSAHAHRRTPRLQLAKLQPASAAASATMEMPMAMPELSPSPAFNKGISLLARAWQWLQQRSRAQQTSRKLRICESAQLGDKRFVAIIQADGQRFLVGGTTASMSLIAPLPADKNSFQNLLHSELTVNE